MNKNKILICLYIPLIEKSYDLFIPINKKIGTIKRLIEEGLIEITENDYVFLNPFKFKYIFIIKFNRYFLHKCN